MSYQRSAIPQVNGQPTPHNNNNKPYFGIGDMPSMDTAQQTVIWQQNQYLIDSGINSETTSNAPSVCSRIESDPEVIEVPQSHNYENLNILPSYGQPLMNGNAELLCAKPAIMEPAMYSNPMEGHVPSERLRTDNRMESTSPNQMLRDAVCNLISYQDERNLLENAIPELNYMLNLDDQVVVGRAALMIRELSKKEATRLAIINSPQLIASVVQGINTTTNLDVARNMVGTLHNISHYVQGLMALYRTGVIPTLVKLLSTDSETLLFYAITILHNLLLNLEESKAAVRAEGGVRRLSVLLQNNNEKFLAITVDCLIKLTQGNPESKVVVMSSNGTIRLVRIMQTHSYEKLLWLTARALKMLSCCSENKKVIIEAGGMSAMARHLHTPSMPLLENCLLTMRNISDIASEHIKGGDMNIILETLVHFMNIGSANVVTCAAGTLCNLTCNNQANKMFVCHIGGIETLVRTLVQFGNKEEIAEPAVRALRHLTSGHPKSETAQNAVQALDGIPLLVKLLQPPSRWPIMKEIIWLLRNLALSPGNQAPLREHGAIPKVVQILMRAHRDIMKQPKSYVDGVKMEDVVLGTVAALHVLSREAQNRSIMRNMGIEEILVKLLHHSKKGIQSEAGRMLENLKCDSEMTRMNQLEVVQCKGSMRPYNESSVCNHDPNIHPQQRDLHLIQQNMTNSKRPQAVPGLNVNSVNMPNVLHRPHVTWDEEHMGINSSELPSNPDFSDLSMANLEMGYDAYSNHTYMPGNGMGWFK